MSNPLRGSDVQWLIVIVVTLVCLLFIVGLVAWRARFDREALSQDDYPDEEQLS